MKITLAAVGSRPKAGPVDDLLDDYLERIVRYVPCESLLFGSEAAFLASLDRQTGRTRGYAILLDSRGQQLSSEELAGQIGMLRDTGTQRLILAIGPADGWSPIARNRADLLFSLGRVTLPHQLARVILAEQIYRAFTILSGHPYHCGH